MAIVKEKVTEYQNGQKVGTYTQVNIPASVVSSINETTSAAGEIYNKVIEEKAKYIENLYHKLNDNIIFLSNFKALNDDFQNTINFFEKNINDITDKKGNIIFGSKKSKTFNIILITVFIISGLIAAFGYFTTPKYEEPSIIYNFGMSIWVPTFCFSFLYGIYILLVGIPLSLKKMRKYLEDLQNKMSKSNLFVLSDELGKVINFYNSEEQKTKLYNNEISKEDYDSNLVNALKKAIEVNFINKNFSDKSEVNISSTDKKPFGIIKVYLYSFIFTLILLPLIRLSNKYLTYPEAFDFQWELDKYLNSISRDLGSTLFGFAVIALIFTCIIYFIRFIKNKIKNK